MPVSASPNKFETERNDLVSLDLPNPGAGLFVDWPVPPNLVVHIVGIRFNFFTAAPGPDRWPYVCITSDGLPLMHRLPVMQSQPQFTAWSYSMQSKWASLFLAPVSDTHISHLCPHLRIKAGERLHIRCFNMNAADQMVAIRIRYHEWKED